MTNNEQSTTRLEDGNLRRRQYRDAHPTLQWGRAARRRELTTCKERVTMVYSFMWNDDIGIGEVTMMCSFMWNDDTGIFGKRVMVQIIQVEDDIGI